jgi:hypothetical protein
VALRLQKREIPTVEFRAVLPEWLGPGGECFVEIDARAAGSINAPFVMAIEKAMQQHRIGLRKLGKIEDDAEYIEADAKLAAASTRNRLCAIYDHCVIEWRSNIQILDDKDKAGDITCDRASFAELAELRGVPEIVKALSDFEKECIASGKMQVVDNEETVKN